MPAENMLKKKEQNGLPFHVTQA